MLTFTETARARVRDYMEQAHLGSPLLRVAVSPGSSPLAPRYDFLLVEEWEREDEDLLLDAGEFRVLLDAATQGLLDGATVDFVEREGRGGFDVQRSGDPAVAAAPSSAEDAELAERVARLLEERVNPAVAAHGGRIGLAEVRGGVAYLEMSGGCQGCGMARVTLRQGVERMIREAVPEIVGIEDVTDHRSGANPYYTATT